jgi:hypothetical protein
MAGYDPRIARAYGALGYDTFPFEAFDGDGRLRSLDPVQVPDHYKQAVGKIAVQPVWADIYRAISLLANADHRCFMAGLRFVGDSIALAVFKPLTSVAGAQAGHNWSMNYGGTIAQTVSDYAGRSYLVDPAWAKTLADVIDALPERDRQNDPNKPPPRPVSADESPAAWADDRAELPRDASAAPPASGLPPLALLGLRVLSSVLSNWTVRTKVLTTVWWYPASGQPDVDLPGAQAWLPLHTEYAASRRRTVHGIWNPGPPAQVPRIWSSTKVLWRGLGVADMPHMPWQWCAAFYPNAKCAPQIAAAGPLTAVAVDAVGPSAKT